MSGTVVEFGSRRRRVDRDRSGFEGCPLTGGGSVMVQVCGIVDVKFQHVM